MRRFVVLVSTLAVLANGVGNAQVPAFAEPVVVSVTSMAPGIAAVGATIDVAGTGFGVTAVENVVTINGRAASVSTASADHLGVTVPTGATSGPVKVSTASGDGTSPIDLFVPPPPFVPADVEFTARSGTDPVNASVPTANKVALLTFAGYKDDRVAIQLSSGTFGSSTSTARISVLRPNGTTLVGATGFGNAGLWLDTRTLPETGTYTILIDPQGTATGQVTVRTFLVPPDAQTTAEPGGSDVVATTTVPGQNAVVGITGSANQRLSVSLSGSTFGPSTGNASVSVLKPDGSTLVSARGFGTSGIFLDTFKLPTVGTYRLLVDPQGAASGQVTVKVHDVGADLLIDTATDGATVTPVTTTPGQNAVVRFVGSANQLVSAQVSESTFGSSSGSASVSILKPDGSNIAAPRGFGTAGTFIDTVKLPVAGTYSLLVDPAGSIVGQVNVRVFDAPGIEGSLAPGGDAVTATTSVPGQNATLGFVGTAGDRLSLQLTNSTYGSSSGNAQVSVRKPDGTVLVSPRGFGSAGTFVDTFTLPTTGTYGVVIDPQGSATGAVTSRLYPVPTDATVATAADGVTHELATGVPGQNGAFTFLGSADQRVSFLLRNSTYGAPTTSASVTVLKPDGTIVVPARGLGSADLFIDTVTLPSAGTHKILVDPAAAAVGSVKVQTFTVPGSDRGSISVTDGPRTIATTVPGEDAYLTLPATADQRVSLNLTASSLVNATITVLAPDGSTVVSAKTFGTSGTIIDFLPPVTGDHRIVINPSSTNTGSATIQAFDAAENLTVAVPGGDEVTVATSNPGQNAAVTFTGSTGQRVSIQLKDSSFGSSGSSATVSLRAPDGSILVNPTNFGGSGVYLDTKSLPASGTYRIVIDPQATATGQVTVKVHDVPADSVVGLTPGGDPASVATTVPGQNSLVRFDGTADQRVSVHLTDGSFGTSTSNARVSLLRPDGTTLIANTGFSNGGIFLDTTTLPVAGTYTLLIDPQGTTTGQVTVKVHDVPDDPATTLSPGGDPATVATNVPGQNALARFEATAGQRVSVHLTESTYGTSSLSARVSLRRPDGSILIGATGFATGGIFLDTTTLPVAGTYTLLIDPQSTNSGQVTVRVHDVPTDPTINAVLGGDAVPVVTTAAGQNARVSFQGVQGRRVSVELLESTFGTSSNSAKVSVLKPDGTALVSAVGFSDPGTFLDTVVLPDTGVYTILLDPQLASVGSVSVTVHDVPADASPGEPLLVDGVPLVATIRVPGQNSSFSTSELGAGSSPRLRLTCDGDQWFDASLTGPNGSFTLPTFWCGRAIVLNIPSTGQYQLVVNPRQAFTGDFRIELYRFISEPVVQVTPDYNEWITDPATRVQWNVDSLATPVEFDVLFDTSAATSQGGAPQGETSAAIGHLPDGVHWVHVRGVDTLGRQGRTGHQRLPINFAPPVVNEPTSDTHPDAFTPDPDQNYRLNWTSISPGAPVLGYSVTVTQDPLAEPDEVVDTEEPAWEGSLQPGSWWVGIRAVDETGLWGKTTYRHLLVDPDAPAPVEPGPHRVSLTSVGGVDLTIDTTQAISIPDVTVFPDRARSDVAVGHQVSMAYDVTLDASVGDVRTATISIPYQADRLDGADPAGIRIYHFDESRGIWEPVGNPTVVDEQRQTVSTTVSHFSTYTAIAGGPDGASGFAADWPLTPNWCRPPGSDADLDIALMIDSSGSILTSDPDDTRYDAARELVESMPATHRVSVSRFREVATASIGMTELDDQGRSSVLARIAGSSYGGTSLEGAVTGGVDALTATPLPGQPGAVFLLSDGGAEVQSETMDAVDQLGIPIFTFEFGSQPSSSSPMREIAESTGGEYLYRAQLRGSDLTAAYETLAEQLVDNGEDGDDDGLTDCVETRGMLTGLGLYGVSNVGTGPGRYIRTLPNDSDTDGDSLSDGSEMGAQIGLSDNPALIFAYRFLYAAGIDELWSPKSDPRLRDSDLEQLMDAEEAVYRTFAFDEDTDNDTATDYEETRISGTDPLVPDEFVDSRIPGMKPDTLFVPEGFADPLELQEWMPERQYLYSVYNPDTGQCVSGDAGCAAINDYVSDLWNKEGADRFKHNLWCVNLIQTCTPTDIERAVIEGIVDDQSWFYTWRDSPPRRDRHASLREDRLQQILRTECVLLAAEPSECTDELVSRAVDTQERAGSWDAVASLVGLIVEWLPRGAMPQGMTNRVAEKIAKADPIIRNVLKNNPQLPGETNVAYGGRIHRALEGPIKALNDPEISAEVGYLNGIVTRSPGHVRPDLVIGPADKPWAILDFKTAVTGIRNSWAQSLRNGHLPFGYRDVPIFGWFI